MIIASKGVNRISSKFWHFHLVFLRFFFRVRLPTDMFNPFDEEGWIHNICFSGSEGGEKISIISCPFTHLRLNLNEKFKDLTKDQSF